MRGTVASFDAGVGLGRVEDGTSSYLFHCTQIAGGSRTIPVGAQVEFALAPGRHGRWEAIEVSPLADLAS